MARRFFTSITVIKNIHLTHYDNSICQHVSFIHTQPPNHRCNPPLLSDATYHQQDVSLDTFFLFSSTQLTHPHAACSSCSPSGILPASFSPSQPAPKEASPPPAPAPAEPSSPIYTPEQRRAWREKMQKIWADELPKSKPWVLSTSTASISIPSQELWRNLKRSRLRLLRLFQARGGGWLSISRLGLMCRVGLVHKEADLAGREAFRASKEVSLTCRRKGLGISLSLSRPLKTWRQSYS